MSFFGGGPYRSTPTGPGPGPVAEPKRYPVIRISTAERRLVQTSVNSYDVEEPYESEDAMGLKTTRWSLTCRISGDEKLTERARYLGLNNEGVPSHLVVWILGQL